MSLTSLQRRCNFCNFKVQNRLCTNPSCPNSLPSADHGQSGQRPPLRHPPGQSHRPPLRHPPGQSHRPPLRHPPGQGQRPPFDPVRQKVRNFQGKIQKIYLYRFASLIFCLFWIALFLATLYYVYLVGVNESPVPEFPGGPIIIIFLIASFVLVIVSSPRYMTSVDKKIIGIVDNIVSRKIRKRRWLKRRAPMGTIQALSFRIIVPRKGQRTIIIPSLYERPRLKLRRGDTVEAYGYFRHSELNIKRIEVKN